MKTLDKIFNFLFITGFIFLAASTALRLPEEYKLMFIAALVVVGIMGIHRRFDKLEEKAEKEEKL